MMNSSTTSKALMYAGLIPFFAGTIAILLELDAWWIIDDTANSFALYVLAIASFISGIHWAVAQLQGNRTELLLHTNLMVLLPWIAFVAFGDGAIFYFLLAFVFFKQYLLDRQLKKQGFFDQAYLRDRLIIATTVCVLMLIIAAYKVC